MKKGRALPNCTLTERSVDSPRFREEREMLYLIQHS